MDLSESNLQDAHLSDADLFLCNLRHANLSRATLDEAQIVRSNLDGANLFQASLKGTDLSNSSLMGANLSEAFLNDVSLIEANLNAAIFEKATLSAVNLKNAVLLNSTLSDGSLYEVNISGAYISQQEKQLLHARDVKGLDQVRIPVTFEAPKVVQYDPSIIQIRITEEPLTAQNVAAIISALTEFTTKCWLIAHGRFSDLIEYSQTNNRRFDKEANLIIIQVTYNSPFEIKLSISPEAVAQAVKILIDAVVGAKDRKREAELKNKALAEEIERKQQEAEAARSRKDQARQIQTQRELIDLYDKQLELRKKQIDLTDYVFEKAPKLVDLLYPNADANTRAMASQTLIKNLLQLDQSEGLQRVLPTIQEKSFPEINPEERQHEPREEPEIKFTSPSLSEMNEPTGSEENS